MNSPNMLYHGLIFAVLLAGSMALNCVLNDAEPIDDPNNIYKCGSTQTCCRDSAGPSCCDTPALTASMSKQIKIWGGILFIVIAVVFIVCCCRKSYVCCEGDDKSKDDKKPRGCCSCCKRKPKNAERIP